MKNLTSYFLLLLFVISCSSNGQPASEQNSPFTDQEIGQMILVGFRGTEIKKDSPIYKDIKERNIAGVVLFERDVITGDTARNISDPTQLLSLASSIVANSTTPPIIAVDQEGGMVSRLNQSKGFPVSRSAEWLGNQDIEDTTRYYAKRMAQEFMVVGLNTNFAPVVDVNTNPQNPVISRYERSFSSDPDKVIEHAGYTINEYSTEGLLTVLKHFPGHGSSSTDSHLGVTDVSETWDAAELEPYKALFDTFDIRAVMTAHIYNAQLDSVWPSTLSENTINGLLRDSLGFEGVVFSDDMQMKAITSEYGLETAITQAVNAGVDILIFGNNLVYDENIASKAIAIIQEGIRTGDIDAEKVRAALDRVGKLKKEVIEDLCTCLNF
ncbi:glycoside hydrolase family 3 protein [Balneola sp. MJW-20]|uniref:glycoside hydrolase family 3 protein n=1 Tax=Gracilimonas aurantiaca TaxID=3234185 RepID=UPI00346597E8